MVAESCPPPLLPSLQLPLVNIYLFPRLAPGGGGLGAICFTHKFSLLIHLHIYTDFTWILCSKSFKLAAYNFQMYGHRSQLCLLLPSPALQEPPLHLEL